VLIHGSESITYPAESSLEPEESDEPIAHPLLNRFFSGFEEGRYQRNEVPWPDTNS
jgi:heat shock protein HspQ